MRKAVPIYPTHLDGQFEGEPTGVGPYYLGIEGEVMLHWGEKISDAEAKQYKLPIGTGIVDGCVFHYSKPSGSKDLRSVSDVKNRTVARKIEPPPAFNPNTKQKKGWKK
jgi:hypothetical protein